MKINKINAIFFREICLFFAKDQLNFQVLSVNPQFVDDVFITYKRGEEFFTKYLETEKYEQFLQSPGAIFI